MSKEKEQASQKQSTKLYSLLAMTGSMTFFFVSPIFVLLFLGMWVDALLGTKPFVMIVGTIVGFVVGITSILFFLKKLSKN